MNIINNFNFEKYIAKPHKKWLNLNSICFSEIIETEMRKE